MPVITLHPFRVLILVAGFTERDQLPALCCRIKLCQSQIRSVFEVPDVMHNNSTRVFPARLADRTLIVSVCYHSGSQFSPLRRAVKKMLVSSFDQLPDPLGVHHRPNLLRFMVDCQPRNRLRLTISCSHSRNFSQRFLRAHTQTVFPRSTLMYTFIFSNCSICVKKCGSLCFGGRTGSLENQEEPVCVKPCPLNSTLTVYHSKSGQNGQLQSVSSDLSMYRVAAFRAASAVVPLIVMAIFTQDMQSIYRSRKISRV